MRGQSTAPPIKRWMRNASTASRCRACGRDGVATIQNVQYALELLRGDMVVDPVRPRFLRNVPGSRPFCKSVKCPMCRGTAEGRGPRGAGPSRRGPRGLAPIAFAPRRQRLPRSCRRPPRERIRSAP